MPLDSLKIRADFPPLNKTINGKPPIYLDSACSSLRPASVIEAMAQYYNEFPGCHGRSLHYFGERTSGEYELAREAVRRFIHARKAEEIIFVKNTTEGINLLSNIMPLKNKKVLISELEHNSNLLPWQRLKSEKGIDYDIFKLNEDLTFSMERFRDKLDKKVGLIALPHLSNITGVVYPIGEIARIAHENGSLLLVDGAQAVSSNIVDVQKDDIDFYVFSGHKMLGPSGVGCFYGKKELLDSYPPFMLGGQTVTDSSLNSFSIAALPDKYEAGVQNYAGAMGLRAAISYIEKIGIPEIKNHIIELNSLLSEALGDENGVNIIGPKLPTLRSGIFNFYVSGVDSFMVGNILNTTQNIMVRAGKHCAHSWYNEYRIPDSIRASFFIYNTPDEIKVFAREIRDIIKYYRK